jgi:hypothetical protein
VRKGFSAVKDELINAGVGILRDTVKQVPARQSFSHHVKNFGTNLTDRAVRQIDELKGSGRRYKRKRQSSVRTVPIKKSKNKAAPRTKGKKKKKTVKKNTRKKGKQVVGKKANKKLSAKAGCKKRKKNCVVDIFS